MSKNETSLRSVVKSSTISRRQIKSYILNKYYNLFMNAYTWIGLDYQQKDYLMRKLWATGTIAAFKIKNIDELGFAPYAPFKWNMYDYPEEVTLVNERGVPFIPKKTQIVDKDVVLIWCQRNKKSVMSVVEYYADKIADVEMTIRTNLKAHKTPWIIGVSPEDKNKMVQLFNAIEKDNPRLFVDLNDINSLKALVSGAPYIIDKLYSYQTALDNELMQYFGFNNLGNQEKKEHLITSEVNANNEITKSSGDCILDVLIESTERIKEVLGIEISVELNRPEEVYIDEDNKPDNPSEEDSDNA